jgi:transcriptional regulator with XRE-family HTH domain
LVDGEETNGGSSGRRLSKLLKQLGRNIKAERVRLGWRQADIVERLGIDYRHYQEIEGGRVNVRLGTIIEIAHVLKVPLGELIDCG